MSRAFDVIIVGGGPVGGVLGLALAQADLQVAIIDHENPQAEVVPSFDGRALSVALTAQRAMVTVDLWPNVAPHAAAIERIRVADGKSPATLHYHHEEIGEDPFGWVVESEGLRRALAIRLGDQKNLTRLAPMRIAQIERGDGVVTVTLKDGEVLTAPLIVGADGRRSMVRDSAGIAVKTRDYDQMAIVCTVAHEKPHANIAHELFLPAGPFAILPLPRNRSGIVWTEKPHIAAAIMKEGDAVFLDELRSRFGQFLGALTLDGPRYAHPLAFQLADAYWVPRLALVGDAAHAMHPVAGQGMNMGLRDASALAERVVESRRLGLDIGGAQTLEGYARWRRFDNLLMLGMTDGLVRLFSNEIKPLKLARDLGLAAVNRMPAAKRLFTRHAMGLEGDLPRLMRGEAL
ncbi:MAG TPA: UbiH/UbiF/VisC/COQ6 family ubiquinone biosynthesis hydroxylase [Magnetospirillaceae bacterium]|jgi:2-octaprenyl-6-methoxyphenol hydroxylase